MCLCVCVSVCSCAHYCCVLIFLGLCFSNLENIIKCSLGAYSQKVMRSHSSSGVLYVFQFSDGKTIQVLY